MEFAGLSADPTYEQAAQISLYSGDGYRYGKLDEVFIIYNHAKNAAEQKLIEQQVLPINQQSYAELLGLNKQENPFKEFLENTEKVYGDIDFEPDPESVMFYLMKSYLRNAYYYALLDSAAGEQGARRNAMKSATDNANEMVSTLTRIYNRARQGAITTEITEIVGGAAALEE
jgi:F-type H+-transporting ATPase subunit gamma